MKLSETEFVELLKQNPQLKVKTSENASIEQPKAIQSKKEKENTMSYKYTEADILQCFDCKKNVVRKSPNQIYCATCSKKRDVQRKALWQKEHPEDKQKNGERQKVALAKARERGLEISRNQSEGMSYIRQVDLLWLVKVKIPFSYAISKNHIYTTTREGHIHLRQEHKSYRNGVELLIANALKGRKIVQNKVWLDFMVEKPNHKGDAINIVDGVCDALKVAIGLDDRWFSIRWLDWKIVKENPHIFIGIGQDSDIDSQICSLCGRLLPFTMFAKNKSGRHGINRTCSECRSVQRKGERLN
jgi:hypothetical protein